MSKPFVSVVMPAFNAAKYIDLAIQSILNQTYPNFEFIIINDASTDNTKNKIEYYKNKDKRIILLNNKKNLGVTESLNKGLARAKGKYVVRMDADDWSYPKRILTQVQLMESNPKIVISGSYINICDDKLKCIGLRKYKIDDINIRKHMFRYSPFAHPATIWRAKDIKEERYSTSAMNAEDYELYFRIGKRGLFMNIDEPLLKLRMHNNSISYSVSNMQSNMTIWIRWNAARNLGYKMSPIDIIYNLLQATIVRLIPIKSRFWLFNFLRKFDIY